VTGLKLFGKTAFFVKSNGGFATFLRKPDADAFAAKVGGEVIEAVLYAGAANDRVIPHQPERISRQATADRPSTSRRYPYPSR
ncbi:hypothetical protein C2W62_54060, partial [Candidatus Entotheonella serta]